MKKITILFALLVAMSAPSFCQSYISSNDDIRLEVKSLQSFTTPNLYVIGKYNPELQTWYVMLKLVEVGFDIETPPFEFNVTFSKAEVDAFTGAGAGDTAKAQNALEQTVKDWLEALNPSVTFTIN